MSVAVIIPFYNAHRYLPEAIESCLIQKEVSQIILIDDGSDDGSSDTAKEYASKHKKVTLVKNQTNLGRSTSRNKGLEIVATPYFTFLDADDYYLPNRFAGVVGFLESNKGCDGVYETIKSQYEIESGKSIYPKVTGIKKNIVPTDLFEYLILGEESLSILGCVFRNSSLSHFRFDPNLSIGEDTDYLWRIAYNYKLCGIPSAPKVIRRVHGKNTFFQIKPGTRGKFEFYKKWLYQLDDFNMSDEMKKKIVSSYAYYKSKAKSDTYMMSKIIQRSTHGIEYLKRPSLWPSLLRK